MGLPISRITIRNFAAIEDLEFSPGAITEFKGKNGRGKSSALNAIIAAFKGCKAELVREGESEAQVVILLNDGTTIERRIKREGKQPPPRIKPQGGAAVTAPASWLSEQIDELFNPLEFVTAPPEKRLAWLLEALPLAVTPDELVKASDGFVSVSDARVMAANHALVAIDQVHARVYEARRVANVATQTKEKSAEEFRGTLPAADDEATDWVVVEQELARQLGAVEERLRNQSEMLVKERDVVKFQADQEFDTKRSGIIAEINRRIAELKAEGDRQISTLRAECERKKSAAEIRFAEQSNDLITGIAEEREGIATSLGEARAKRTEWDRAENTRKVIAKLEAEAAVMRAEWQKLDAAVDNLATLKSTLLERVPIEGIETRDGRLYRNGLPFEVLNTAQCMEVAMEVAEIRAGKIGLICVDGIERLDPENQAIWYERAKSSGLHFVFTQVTNDESLVINSIPDASEAVV